MNAAIQLVNQPIVNTSVIGNTALVGNVVEGNFNNVSRFEAAPEQRLRRALEYIGELQSEIRALHDELARSERVSANYEVLLRNANVREYELRAQLAQGRY